MQLTYSTEGTISFKIIPEYFEDFLPVLHELNFRRCSNRALVIASIHEQPFPLAYCYRIIDHKDVTSAAQNKGLEKVRVIARIIQTLPWKWLQLLACPTCAVWGVLQCHNLRRMVRSVAGNSLEQTSLLVAVDVPVDCLHRSMNPTQMTPAFRLFCLRS